MVMACTVKEHNIHNVRKYWMYLITAHNAGRILLFESSGYINSSSAFGMYDEPSNVAKNLPNSRFAIGVEESEHNLFFKTLVVRDGRH